MSNLNIYHNGKEIPLPLYYQAETFVRLQWADDEDYDVDDGLDEPAIHITLSQGNSLISYASLIWTDVKNVDTTYHCYGLRSVFTFPASRRRGYGGQVVRSATKFIENQPNADIALLWTEPQNVDFYARQGWIAMPNMTTLFGEPDAPDVFDEETAMMLFISDKGKSGKGRFDTGRIYVGEEPW